MPFCDDLKVLFPNYVMEYHKGSISVKEKSASAKVREVVWCNADFQYIDPTIVKDMTSFFQKSGAPDIFHADCDGIMIFEGNDGRKYMFFSELKSSFDSSDIFYAKDQIISSYLKINLIMHLLRCYNPDDFIVKGFIMCLPPDRNYLRDLYKQQFTKPGSKYSTEADFTLDLCYNKEKQRVLLTPSDCHKLKGLPLGNTGIFRNIEFHYIEVPKGCSTITLDIAQYL